MTMTRSNIARLIATVAVVATVVFVSLDIDHPKWTEDLAWLQHEGELSEQDFERLNLRAQSLALMLEEADEG